MNKMSIVAIVIVVLIVVVGVAYVLSRGGGEPSTDNDFTISASPTSDTVNQGGSTSFTLSLSYGSEFSGTVSLASSGLPSGATDNFTQESGTSSFTSTLTISTDSTTPAGTYKITITGIGGGKTNSTTFSLKVASGSYMVLKAIQIADANSLDVDRTKLDQAMQVIALTQDTLMTYDDNMNYIPLLAESWDIGENGLYIDWHLRHDVTFQSGAPLDAYAVKYSIDRAGRPESVQSDTVADILAVEVLDQYTVRVHLKEWNRWLYDWFAETSSSIVSNAPDPPYSALGDDPAYGITKFDGTGPFKIKQWTQNTKTVLVRNDNYTWGPAIYQNRGPALLNEIDIQIDTNSLTSEDKFFTGEVDMMIGFSSRPALISRLSSDSNVNPNFIYSRSSLAWIGFTASSLSPEIENGLESGIKIPANHPVSPLDDTKKWIDLGGGVLTPDNTNKGLMVRRALLYATNKDAMLQYGGWEGLGKVAYGPLTSEMWGYNPAVETMYPYDPDYAKSLLAQAGYPGGSPTNMVLHITGYTASGNDTYVAELVQLKDQWKQVGVDLTIQELPFDSIESKIADDAVDIFTGGYTWPNADMLWWYWHTVRVPPGPNRFWWGNAYTDAVIDNTFAFDDNVAFKAIQEAQVLIMEDAMFLPVVERPFLLAMRLDVKGLQLTPLNNFNWKMLDTYIG